LEAIGFHQRLTLDFGPLGFPLGLLAAPAVTLPSSLGLGLRLGEAVVGWLVVVFTRWDVLGVWLLVAVTHSLGHRLLGWRDLYSGSLPHGLDPGLLLLGALGTEEVCADPGVLSLKGVFSADVVRRLHCGHPEAQEGDAAQDALLLLIFVVEETAIHQDEPALVPLLNPGAGLFEEPARLGDRCTEITLHGV